MEKIGGSAELHLRNATRDSLGVLTNIGNGRTRFIRARRVGDTLFIGKDTILITNDPTIQEVINNGNTISEADSIKIADGNTFTLFAGVGSTLQTKAVNTTSQTEDRFTPDLIVTRMRNLSTGNYKGYSMSSATPGISIFDQQTTSGMGYEADYRANGIANFGNRWIPDWGAINEAIHDSVSTISTSQWITTGSDIYYNTGNVGINTSSPGSKLEIMDGALGLKTTGGSNISVSNNNYDLLISNTIAGTASFRLLPFNDDIYYENTSAIGGQIFRLNGSEKMRLNGGGELLIGSTTDQGAYTLQNTGGLYQNGTVSLNGTFGESGAWKFLVKNPDSTVAQINKNAVTIDSITIGTAIYSRRGFTSSPSIASPNYFTFQSGLGYVINESVNTATPIIQQNGLSSQTLTYAGIFMTVNQRAPNTERQHMLITTSGNSQSTNGLAGNIILRTGSRASVGAPTLQDTHDSVLIDLNGNGKVIIQDNDAQYNANFAANYTARSLTDKNYVDSSMATGGGWVTVSATTTNNTPVVITPSTTSGAIYHLEMIATAVLNDGNGGYTCMKSRGLLKNAGGTGTAGTLVSTNADEYYGSGLTTANATIIASGNNLAIEYTGETGDTILWTIKYRLVTRAAPL